MFGGWVGVVVLRCCDARFVGWVLIVVALICACCCVVCIAICWVVVCGLLSVVVLVVLRLIVLYMKPIHIHCLLVFVCGLLFSVMDGVAAVVYYVVCFAVGVGLFGLLLVYLVGLMFAVGLIVVVLIYYLLVVRGLLVVGSWIRVVLGFALWLVHLGGFVLDFAYLFGFVLLLDTLVVFGGYVGISGLFVLVLYCFFTLVASLIEVVICVALYCLVVFAYWYSLLFVAAGLVIAGGFCISVDYCGLAVARATVAFWWLVLITW